ncbi:MAG: AAA family ATPase [Saprospiraceae bacterium]
MILKSIEIENFRCFRHSRFENFSQVNLIGGMNNSGKTALLEAILLGNEPTFHAIRFLQDLRTETIIAYSRKPELAWSNLFYRHEKNQTISIVSEYENNHIVSANISCSEKVRHKPTTNGKDFNGEELIKVVDNSDINEVEESSLIIIASSPTSSARNEMTYRLNEDAESRLERLKSSYKEGFTQQHSILMMPTGYKKPGGFLAREFDEAKLKNEDSTVLKAFQIIDNSIEKIDTINLGEPRIYIFRKNEKPQPLNFFGDALNKIADLILRVSNNPNCILLIDEIENGIHHTNQHEFWQMLIKLAVAKDVQIFATSHSAEMIKAFQTAATANKQEDKVRFIEMYKSQRTGEIVGDPVDMETLAFDIQNNNPYRGEE